HVRQGSEMPRVVLAVVRRYDVDRDVAGLRIVFQPVQNRPAVAIRQADVERDGIGVLSVGQGQRGVAMRGDYPLEASLVRYVEQDLREQRVIFDHQHDAVPRQYIAAVVGDFYDFTVIDGRERRVGILNPIYAMHSLVPIWIRKS